jgi:hypothetical protein
MPMIKVLCECGERLHTPDENAGMRGQCPSCRRIFEIPEPDLENTAVIVEAPDFEAERGPPAPEGA